MSLISYAPSGVYGIYMPSARPPGAPKTFDDQAQARERLREFTRTPALRHTLYLNYVSYVGNVPVTTADEALIAGLAEKLVSGELVLQQLSAGTPARGDTAGQCRPSSSSKKPEKKLKEVKRPSRRPAKVIKPPGSSYKIVIEVAGTALTGCCCDRLVAAAAGPGRAPADHQRMTNMANAGRDDHRHEVKLTAATQDTRAIYLNPGCNADADAVCPIPLHAKAKPVEQDAESNRWPTALVPVVPLAFTDAHNTPEKAAPLRNGWLYIYLNGRLWRELYACGDNTFRDVNLGLPNNAGADVRAPTGWAVTTILVPYTIEGRVQKVELAFAEAQWTWHTICAMGGPADDDPRFLPKVVRAARKVPVDRRRRERRFYTPDLSAYPGPFTSADGCVLPIEEAPRPEDGRKDPLARLRDKKIAVVILEDPLLVARRLAAEYQQAWREMQALLESLARAPETSIREKTYPPGRWFESAVLANSFFFAPFPGFDAWQRLHPGADRNAWQKAVDHRDRMQARLDRQAIDEALGGEQRKKQSLKIDKTRQDLIDFLAARTKDELDLFVLMLDDYFVLPQTAGIENTPGKNPYGYADGWGAVEQLIAQLGDHSLTLDADLLAQPPDTARLTRDNPGTTFLNTIADPKQGHVLYARLFPKPAGDSLTPDTRPIDTHAPVFKPQRFADKDQPGTEPVADFARHYARAALVCDHPRVQQSITRLINAVFDWQLAEQQVSFEELEQNGALNAASPEEKRSMFAGFVKANPSGPQVAAFLRRLTLFSKQSADRAVDGAAQATTTQVDIYSLHKLSPKKHQVLTADNLHDWDFEMATGRSMRVKNPPSGAKNAFVVLPNGLKTTLNVINRQGKIIGGQSLKDFMRGIFDPRQWEKLKAKRRNTKWYKTRVNLTISRKPDALARLGRMLAERKVVSRVIIPLAVMFETWNVSHAATNVLENSKSEELSAAKIELLGAIVDFGSLSAATAVYAVEGKSGKPLIELAKQNGPKAWQFKVLGWARGGLGIAAGAFSAYFSGRDMLVNIEQNDDATMAHGVMLTGFTLSTIYETAWACNFLHAAALKAGPLAWAEGIIGGPLQWISLGVVLAGAALLVFVLREDTLLEQWLANGPFSVRTFTPNLVAAYDETAVAGDLLIDENGCLAGVVPSANNKLVQKDGAIFQVNADGKPIKKIGEIGRCIQTPPIFKDNSGRFARHRPGDTDFGPPPGASVANKRYTGTGKVMEFWKEADGSHLWITMEGILHDYYICRKPAGNSRLFLDNGVVYLKQGDEQVLLGRKGDPIQNRDKLLVDRKDDPTDKNIKFRNWCEKPAGAYQALAAALFTPRVQTGFSAVAKPGVKCPAADPFKGFDYRAHVHVGLPHFIEGRSRLLVQLWQAGVEKVPQLIYDARIAVHVDDNDPLRQISIAWPLKDGYDRRLEVSIRVKLDLYGDGKLCLPLDPDSGKPTWMTETRRVDKLELKYAQDPLAILMEVGM